MAMTTMSKVSKMLTLTPVLTGGLDRWAIAPYVEENDFEHLVRLVMSVHNSDPLFPTIRVVDGSFESFAKWINRDAFVARWVLRDENGVVGHVQIKSLLASSAKAMREADTATLNETDDDSVESSEKFLEVSKLCVNPNAQGRGYGRALARFAVEQIQERDAKPMLTVLEASSNARKLYVSMGFVEVNRFDGLDGVNVVMRFEE